MAKSASGRSRGVATSPARITDLAAELGYSASTVSRALNGHSAVRPELARHIREHAAKRGYVANRLAQSLVGRSRRFVGFLVPDLENRAYLIAANTVAEQLARSGHQLIVAVSGDDPDSECAALESLVGAQAAALIVAPTAAMSDGSKALLAMCPVVQYNRALRLGTATVLCSDRPGLASAARHLVTLGHRDIGYLGTSDTLSNGRERVRGFRDALAEAGITPSERLLRLLPPTEHDGYVATGELLAALPRPTALIVGSSNLSLGAARAVKELGLRVPEDLSLVVYGDAAWGELLEPRLTTISVPYRAMGERVARVVVSMLAAEGTDKRPPRHRLQTELVVRESTAKLRAANRGAPRCASKM